MSDPNKAEVAQKGPYRLEMKAGTYYYCACGRSKGQPFCDGSHKGTAFEPKKVEITQPRRVSWCGCRCSKSGFECDGSHKTL